MAFETSHHRFLWMLIVGTCLTLSAAKVGAAEPAIDEGSGVIELSSYESSWSSELDQLRNRLEQLEQASVGSPVDRQSESASLSAGFEFVWLKPYMKESFQSTSINIVSGQQTLHPFQFDHELTPRLWLAVSGEDGLGLRARFWEFNHRGSHIRTTATPTSIPTVQSISVIFPGTIAAGAVGDVLESSSGYHVQTIDLDGTLPARLSDIDLLLSAGLRYAMMHQEFDSRITGSVDSRLSWEREFEGLGLSVAADASTPLGTSGLKLVGGIRGSLLYGEKRMRRVVKGDVTTPTPAFPELVFDNVDEVSGVFDLALGVEWSQDLCDSWNLAVRGTYENQLWTAAGAPTLTFLGFDGFGLTLALSH